MGHENDELLQTFRFQVTLTLAKPDGASPAKLWDGAFSECSGLELEADIKDHLEGGRNDGIVRRVGRVKLSPIVLKRGIFVLGKDESRLANAPSSGKGAGTADDSMWAWLTHMVSGHLPVARYNGHVEVWDSHRIRVVAEWTFDRGLPSKVTGPTLNAKTGEIAIEELHIVHEGLRMGPQL